MYLPEAFFVLASFEEACTHREMHNDILDKMYGNVLPRDAYQETVSLAFIDQFAKLVIQRMEATGQTNVPSYLFPTVFTPLP